MINKNLSHMFKGSILALCLSSPLYSLEVNIKEGLPYVDVDVNGENIRIQRIQDTSHKLKNSYVKTSRQSPPFIIQPFVPIKGIKTVTELDVMEFIKNEVSDNEGILLDARMPKWYENGTIPGALNIPFSILSTKDNSQYIDQIFDLLGVEKDGEKWNFDFAQKLLVFDNGPWCQQGVHAMKSLVAFGYPKNKIFYYRGGMQFWQILGLGTYKTK
jgi:rhodanese-related sulfurtransferase